MSTKLEVVVRDIECLYPPDTNDEGRELLIQALCGAWRHLPLGVLLQLRHLCIQKGGRGAGK